jgi:hypothetical protein
MKTSDRVAARLSEALLDRYAVLHEIGAGGMATVYLARDLRHGRDVAIKVMRPELASGVAVERFLREIGIAAQLQHPNVLPLLDSGSAAEFLFYVMPFVAGESLRQRLEREPQLPVDDAVVLALEVAEALAHAHERGVVHRDIKPENILLSGGRAMVADFGVARAVDQAGRETLTATGIAIGTPAYMSPEQGGGTRELDGRSDIYSLGVVVYEMLAGQQPFQGATPQTVIVRHARDPVPPLRSARPDLPEALERVVMRALAKAPADRFRSAAAFAAALREARAAPAAVVAAPSAHGRRRNVVTWVAGLAVLGLIAVGTLRPAGSRAGTPQPAVLIAAPALHDADSGLGRVIATALESALLASGSVRLVDGQDITTALRAMGRDTLAALDDSTAREVVVRAGAGAWIAPSVRRVGAGYVLTAAINAADGSRRALAQASARDSTGLMDALDALTRSVRRDLGEQLDSLQPSASLLYLLTPSLAAVRLYAEGVRAMDEGRPRPALSLFERAVAADSNFVLALVQLSELRKGQGGDWLEPLERAGRLAERLPADARLLVESQVALFGERDFRRAEQLADLMLRLPPPRPASDLIYGWSTKAIAAMELGRPADAIDALNRLEALPGFSEPGEAGGRLSVRGRVAAMQNDSAAVERIIAEIHRRQRSPYRFEAMLAAASHQWRRAEASNAHLLAPDRAAVTRHHAFAWRGVFEALRGRPVASRAAFRAAEALAEEVGDTTLLVTAQLDRAYAELFALDAPDSALAIVAPLLTSRAVPTGLARRNRSVAVVLAAGACALWTGRVLPGICGALAADSARDAIEHLEAAGWLALRGRNFDAVDRLARDRRLANAGLQGQRARLPGILALERRGLTDSAVALYRELARPGMGRTTQAAQTWIVGGFARRRLAALHGPAADQARAALAVQWADAEPEFRRRIAEPLLGAAAPR